MSLKIFYEEFPHQKDWYGFRLLGVDGSKVELPNDPEVIEYFGLHNHAHPMGILSTLYDLQHRIWLDAKLAPIRVGERELAASHLATTQENDWILYDRGYNSFWFLALHRYHERHFCMRIQKSFFKETDAFLESGEREKIVTIQPSAELKKACTIRNLSHEPLILRLIRVDLSSDQVEILAVSLLDTEAYPFEIFADLYHQRWGHEEGYKQVKVHAELQNWSGKCPHTLFQDLYAKLLTLNLTAMHAIIAQIQVEQKTENRKYDYQVNRSKALSQMKDMLVMALNAVNPLPWLHKITNAMANNIEPIRSGRSYARKPRLGVGIRFRAAHKRC